MGKGLSGNSSKLEEVKAKRQGLENVLQISAQQKLLGLFSSRYTPKETRALWLGQEPEAASELLRCV